MGVCTVCAKVCHKDHEISYAKYGSFFCDCGAKEDGSCLVRDGAFTVSYGQLVSNTGVSKAENSHISSVWPRICSNPVMSDVSICSPSN